MNAHRIGCICVECPLAFLCYDGVRVGALARARGVLATNAQRGARSHCTNASTTIPNPKRHAHAHGGGANTYACLWASSINTVTWVRSCRKRVDAADVYNGRSGATTAFQGRRVFLRSPHCGCDRLCGVAVGAQYDQAMVVELGVGLAPRQIVKSRFFGEVSSWTKST